MASLELSSVIASTPLESALGNSLLHIARRYSCDRGTRLSLAPERRDQNVAAFDTEIHVIIAFGEGEA
jgi:hypothetical protein